MVELIREGPYDGGPLVVLAHGAGAPQSHAFMTAVAAALAADGISVARFDFPYMADRERTGKRRPPNPPKVLLAAWRDALDRAVALEGAGPIVLAGKSLGGRMASMMLAAGDAPEARGAAYLGYPLHPPGKKDKLRDAHLPEVGVPQLFIQGSKDSLCDLDLLRPVLDRIGESARLFVVEGGDHSLARSRKDPLGGSKEWLAALSAFVREVS